MNTQLFNLPKEAYSRTKADQLYKEDRIKALQYVQHYIFHCYYPAGYLFWDYSDYTFRRYTAKEIKETFIPNSITIEKKKVKKLIKIDDKVEDEKDIKEIQTKHSFIKDFDDINILFKCVSEVNKPIIYKENEEYYLNLFMGMQEKYKIDKKYDDFDDETKEQTQALLEHIKNIWCSGSEEHYNFILKWICNVFHFKQNKVGLYLKSGQGTGKGTITNFLLNILGNMGCITQKKKVVTDWNASLSGKVLFVIEEIGFNSPSEWKTFSGILKTYITEPKIAVEDKGKSIYEVDNHLNVIINSNFSAVNIETDDRRWCVLDISNDRKGDIEYFKKLNSYTIKDDVKICFYKYFEEMEEPDNYMVPPITNSKIDIINDNLDPVLKFIKNNYLLQKQSINTSLKELFNEFIASFDGDRKYTIIKFNKTIRDNFGEIDKNNKIYKSMGIEKIKYTNEELLKLYQKNKWIHETDEFITDEEKTNEEDEELNELKEENEKLKEEIERLKKLLEEKEKPKEKPKKETKEEIKKPIKKEVKKEIKKDDDDDDIEIKDDYFEEEIMKEEVKETKKKEVKKDDDDDLTIYFEEEVKQQPKQPKPKPRRTRRQYKEKTEEELNEELKKETRIFEENKKKGNLKTENFFILDDDDD